MKDKTKEKLKGIGQGVSIILTILVLLALSYANGGCSQGFQITATNDIFYPQGKTSKGSEFGDPDKSRGKNGWGSWGGGGRKVDDK